MICTVAASYVGGTRLSVVIPARGSVALMVAWPKFPKGDAPGMNAPVVPRIKMPRWAAK